MVAREVTAAPGEWRATLRPRDPMSPPPGRRPVDLVLLAFAGAEVLALVIATVAWQPTWRALMADFGSSPATFTRVVLGPSSVMSTPGNRST